MVGGLPTKCDKKIKAHHTPLLECNELRELLMLFSFVTVDCFTARALYF
ncbi:hypothetical protein Bsph_4168 [Lysinibacillus sphaericus C3-41]|uniref:Uncharacterized protein n=1 Tax=Lysinibacillus sphaericus (strain C3-41) TaxID=444177 RepID=B1HX53_LYSSC|nr:hypothetical protein Bsph_4168 [Lysinibacillus sphaericus C3-41]